MIEIRNTGTRTIRVFSQNVMGLQKLAHDLPPGHLIQCSPDSVVVQFPPNVTIGPGANPPELSPKELL